MFNVITVNISTEVPQVKSGTDIKNDGAANIRSSVHQHLFTVLSYKIILLA